MILSDDCNEEANVTSIFSGYQKLYVAVKDFDSVKGTRIEVRQNNLPSEVNSDWP